MTKRSSDQITNKLDALLSEQKRLRAQMQQLDGKIAELLDDWALTSSPPTDDPINTDDITTDTLAINSEPLVFDTDTLDRVDQPLTSNTSPVAHPDKATQPTIAITPREATPEYTSSPKIDRQDDTTPPSLNTNSPDESLGHSLTTPEPPSTATDWASLATTDHDLPPETKSPNAVIEWLLRGNLLLKVGVVILFLGVGFLLRYASQYIVVPLPVRYGLVGLAGAATTAFAYVYLRPRRFDYALIVQGTGIAIVYLTVLAAYRLHHLLGSGVAFVLMLLALAVMVGLSLRQNAVALAQVSLLGGLATPILISSGSGDYVSLFTYVALLNTGFAAIAWYKRWRSLNFIAFYGSLALAWLWAASAQSAQAAPLILSGFIAYHLVLYTVVAWRFALHAAEQPNYPLDNAASLVDLAQSVVHYLRHSGPIDHTLTISAAFWSYLLFYLRWLGHGAHTDAFIAAGLGGYYLWCMGLVRLLSPSLTVLKRVFGYLGLLLLTLAIPLYFSQSHTLSLWALQGAVLFGLGWHERNPYWRVIGVILCAAATALLLPQIHLNMTNDSTTVLSINFINWLLLLIASILVVGIRYYYRQQLIALWERRVVLTSFAVGIILIMLLPFMLTMWANAVTALMLLSLTGVLVATRLRADFANVLAIAVVTAWGIWLLWWAYEWSLGYDHVREHLHYLLPAIVTWLISARLLTLAAIQLPSRVLQIVQIPTSQILLTLSFVLIWIGLMIYRNGDEYHLLKLSVPTLAVVTLLWFSGMKLARWTAGLANTLLYLPLLALTMCVRLLIEMVGWRRLHDDHVSIFDHAQVTNLAIADQSTPPSWPSLVLDNYASIPNSQWLLGIAIMTVIHLLTLKSPWPVLQRFSRPIQRAGFITLSLAALWSVWQLIDQYGIILQGWQQWVYWLPVLLLLIYAALPLRSRFLPYETSISETALLWVILVFGFLQAFLSAPAPSSFFLPILNPAALLGVAITALLYWYYRHGVWQCTLPQQNWIMGAALWFSINIEILRLWAVYVPLPWSFETLWSSTAVQTTYTLLWSLQGIALMLWANRRQHRRLWIVGAALLALVVLKLFLIDLSQTNSIARIVSFIGVGILLMGVGYFAPIPPGQNDPATS